MSDTLHAAKKPKPATTAGPPLYSELDLAQLTVDATLLGANETRFATVKYKDTRLVYQLAGVGEAMRVPFGIDDGSKFGSKPSMKLELSDAQLAFVRAVEDKVIDAAVKNKAEWFAGVKPPPSDGEVRKTFSSRVSVDPDGQYNASLRVNVNLADDAKKLKVSTTRRLGDGKIEAPKRGSAADVQWGQPANYLHSSPRHRASGNGPGERNTNVPDRNGPACASYGCSCKWLQQSPARAQARAGRKAPDTGPRGRPRGGVAHEPGRKLATPDQTPVRQVSPGPRSHEAQ
jgi:hypothetical protein